MSEVLRLTSVADLVGASRDDRFVRCSVPPGRAVSGWALDGPDGWSVGWVLSDSTAGWLTVIGEPVAAAALVGSAAGDGTPLRAVTVPRGAMPLLPRPVRPPLFDDWDWFWTEGIGSPLPGEGRVQWLGPSSDAEIAALLDADSPRHSARPGERFVRRWCGIRDATGELVACAAHVEYVAGVPQLASIVTRRDRRGSGLGAAVTAWLTRRLLDEGFAVVTLGMYADNDVARRLYERLGYRLEHRFSSGPIGALALDHESASVL